MRTFLLQVLHLTTVSVNYSVLHRLSMIYRG